MLTLWMRTRSAQRDGKRGRDYRIHSPDGTLRWTAFARRVPGPIDVFVPDASAAPVVRGRPRRSFPISGRYDVIGPDDGRLGVITRRGTFFDANGTKLGRFRDARSMREHVGEGVVTMVVEGILAGDSGAGVASGASAWVVTLEGLPPGRLAREKLPFVPDDEAVREPGRIARGLRRVLPGRAADKLLDRRSSGGWVLDLSDTGTISEHLLLTAAILAIEVALW